VGVGVWAVVGGAIGGLLFGTVEARERRLADARDIEKSLEQNLRHSTKIYEDCQRTEKNATNLLTTMQNEFLYF